MKIKQKWVAGLLSALVIVLSSITLPVLFSPNAYAEYAPDANNKCQNGSDATRRTNRTTRATEYFCADSTKTSTPPASGQTTTPASDTQTGDNTSTTDSDKGVTCAVEKIGWIVCPIMEGAAKVSDKAFDILADNFLRTDPELITDDSGTKVGWEVARNLANIMFIIAFLFIILSQVTGRGLDNYGIKRMLPRLVIAAIAVNVSYYICQLAVDATNILGYEIQNALAQIANSVGPSVFGSVSNFSDTEVANTNILNPNEHGNILSLIVVGALASAAVVWFMLPTIVTLIPIILITIAVIIIILLLRKALIVLLIVISPIAFVMYLLPNTEKLFSRWLKMFRDLLMVFPIIGLLFGAGQLASTIILVAGSNNNQAQAALDCDPDNVEERQQFNEDKSTNDNTLCGEGAVVVQGGKNGNSACFPGQACKVDEPQTASWTLGLVATGIAVAPLLAVWSVLKGAVSAAGAIGGKIESFSRNAGKGAGKASEYAADQMRKGRTARWQRMQARGLDGSTKGLDPLAGAYAKRRALREGRQNLSKTALDRASGLAIEENIGKLTGGLTESETARALRAAKAQEDKRGEEETKAALTAIEYDPKGKLTAAQDAFDDALEKGDFTKIKASVQALTTTGEGGINALADKLTEAQKSGNKELVNGLREYILQAHPTIKEKNSAVEMWAKSYTEKDTTRRDRSVNDWAKEAETFSRLSDAQFSTQTEKVLGSTGAQAALAVATPDESGNLVQRRARLVSNPENARALSDNKRNIIINGP